MLLARGGLVDGHADAPQHEHRRSPAGNSVQAYERNSASQRLHKSSLNPIITRNGNRLRVLHVGLPWVSLQPLKCYRVSSSSFLHMGGCQNKLWSLFGSLL